MYASVLAVISSYIKIIKSSRTRDCCFWEGALAALEPSPREREELFHRRRVQLCVRLQNPSPAEVWQRGW